MSSSALSRAVSGKNVVVTGASDGIGARLVQRLAAAGAHVILVARSPEKLLAVGDNIRASGGHAREYVADISKEEDCARVIAAILYDHDKVDIFVSNAGRSIRRSVQYQATDRFHDFRRLMELNYFGALKMILGVLPGMQAHKSGHIVHVSSFGVPMRQPRFAGYAASKSALDTSLQAIASEVAADGVTTSSVYMPLVQTKMVQSKGHNYDHFSLLTLDEACGLIEKAIVTRQQEVMDVKSKWTAFLYFFLPSFVTAMMAAIYKHEKEAVPVVRAPMASSPRAAAPELTVPTSPLARRPSSRSQRSSRTPGCLRYVGTLLHLFHVLDDAWQVFNILISPLFALVYSWIALTMSAWLSMRLYVLWWIQPDLQAPVFATCALFLASAWMTLHPPAATAVTVCLASVLGGGIWLSTILYSPQRSLGPKTEYDIAIAMQAVDQDPTPFGTTPVGYTPVGFSPASFNPYALELVKEDSPLDIPTAEKSDQLTNSGTSRASSTSGNCSE